MGTMPRKSPAIVERPHHGLIVFLQKPKQKINIDVVDLGVPVLSMHAPYEVVSKLDVYSTYEACLAFFNRK